MNQILKLASGPALFFITTLAFGFDDIQVKMIAVALWMLSWWITGAVPIGITALLPMILYPLLGILNLKATAANYAHPVIYLFFGGFALGLAIEKWNLHKRIALNILKASGDKPIKIVLGCMLATALLSMWISNTATTVMMLPIGMSVISLLNNKLDGEQSSKNFALCVLLGIAYAANIGGISTLIGTPPNLVMSSILNEQNITEIAFSDWIFFAFPLATLLFIAAFLINSKLVFPIGKQKIDGVKELISAELKQLGKFTSGEKRVLYVMIFTALMWIFRSQLTKIIWLKGLSDTIIALIAVLLLFIVPSKKTSKPLLVWNDTKKLPWDILLLFGGGLSLAKGLEISEIVQVVGNWITAGEFHSIFIIILLITLFSLFLTEIMSNVALVAVFVPVGIVVAQQLGLNEIELVIPLTIAASCAFMFPISTPPNAVVFSSGHISMKQMARAGILINIFSVILIAIYSYWLIPVLFK